MEISKKYMIKYCNVCMGIRRYPKNTLRFLILHGYIFFLSFIIIVLSSFYAFDVYLLRLFYKNKKYMIIIIVTILYLLLVKQLFQNKKSEMILIDSVIITSCEP